MQRLSPAKRDRLTRRRAKLAALLPFVKPQRAQRIRETLSKLDAVLGTKPMTSEEYLRESWDASGVDGVGGLYFDVATPPGRGRLVRLPFYPSTVPAIALTAGGLGAASTTNPTVMITAAGLPAGGVLSGFVFTTPQIEWVRMRLVGLQSFILAAPGDDGQGNLQGRVRPQIMIKDLKLGGGANLLPQEGYQSSVVFSARVPELAGLRDYPLVESPNTVSVSAAISGDAGALVTFSLTAVCEVLDDSTFGKTIPGPYARAAALRRTSNEDGEAYVAS